MKTLRRHWRILFLAATLLAATLVVHTATGSRSARSPRTSPASTVPSSPTPPATPGAKHAAQPAAVAAAPATVAARAAIARVFARAYLRFLDGNLTAAQLPAVIARTRRQAIQAGQIPPRDRAGTLTLAAIQSVTPHAQWPSMFVIVAHDHARRSYPAQITVGRVNARLEVTNLLAPELHTILQLKPPPPPRSRIRTRPSPPPSSPPPGLRAATTRFLVTYLPYTYGQLPARRVTNSSPQLRHHLERQPPHIPTAVRSLHPAVRALSFERDPAGGWAAITTVTDRQQTYQLTIKLDHAHGRWLATAILTP
jgi:hypothetical protein